MRGFKVRPGVIRIRAGELIQTCGLQQADRMALASRCRDAVIALSGVRKTVCVAIAALKARFKMLIYTP